VTNHQEEKMGRFLDRYRQGEYKQVWDELLAQGEAIRREPLFTDASAVAHETMQRVRQNIEVLIPRLRTLGYHFGEFWGEDPLPHWRREASSSEESPTFLPFVPPPSEVHQYLEQLEQAVGPLPLSLRVFYAEVGGVNFLGTHPTWAPFIELERLDPLYLDPLTAETLDDFLKGYADYQRYSDDWPGTPFTLNLAPDSYRKYNISGGPPYGMAVPDARIDGLFLHEWHHTTFVDYLRVCFLSGGLPMREWVAVDLSMLKSVWEGGQESKEVTEAVAYLRQGLLPI
jgi:hypothetical protein